MRNIHSVYLLGAQGSNKETHGLRCRLSFWRHKHAASTLQHESWKSNTKAKHTDSVAHMIISGYVLPQSEVPAFAYDKNHLVLMFSAFFMLSKAFDVSGR